MDFNMIVDKLWNGCKALQISRNGLDCQTDGLMIYERPTNAPKKYNIQEVFFWVTKQLQYANEIYSVPNQNFILFKPQRRLKINMEDKQKILCLFY